MKLVPYNLADKNKLYLMLKDLHKKEWDFENEISDTNYDEFLCIFNKYLDEEYNKEFPTKRFVLEDNNKYIGYVGIRLLKDEKWTSKGSQLFYQIRKTERRNGYCNELIKLSLIEMKKHGFKFARINCDNMNIASKKAIIKNGGIVDIKDYKSNTGISSSYIINFNK